MNTFHVRRTRARCAAVAWLLLAPLAGSARGHLASGNDACRVLVIGFGGGIRYLPDFYGVAAPTPLKRDLTDLARPDICTRLLDRSQVRTARAWVRRTLAPEGTPGMDDAAAVPSVVLYGFSSGGLAALRTARLLAEDGVPVDLLVIIDTPWMGTLEAPANVRRAVVYYQRDTWLPIFRGTSRLRAGAACAVERVRVHGAGHFGMPKHARIRQRIVEAAVDLAAARAGPIPANPAVAAGAAGGPGGEAVTGPGAGVGAGPGPSPGGEWLPARALRTVFVPLASR